MIVLSLVDPEHLAVAADLVEPPIDFEVVAIGTDLYGVEALAGVDEALALIGGMGLGEGDAVLVKGSLVAGLQELAERLADG